MPDNNDLDDTVNSILDQLKTVPVVAKKVNQMQSDLTKENLEKFVIQYASRLVENATESVEYIKDNVQAAPTADDVISLAELIKSTSGAIEILNKIVINKEKLQNSVRIKEMDVASKREELEVKVSTTLLASRDEILKQLINKSNVIDITPTS
jgi:hypothetical protein